MTALEHLAKHGGPTLAQAERRYAHGTHARYVLCRCRCASCRVANRDYESERTQDRREAEPWVLDWRGRVSADGYKTIRLRNVLSGEVERVYRIDVEDRHSCQYVPAMAKRRALFLNKRDGNGAARARFLVNAERARRHIVWLRARGMGYKVIAARAGIAPSIIARIAGHKTGYRSIRRIRQDALDAILGIDPDALADGARVDARESKKRLAELVANGWARGFLASVIVGKKVPILQCLYRRGRITARTARRIGIVYDQLRNVRPMARMTRWGPRPIPRGAKKGGAASVEQTRALMRAIRAAEDRAA